MASATLMVLTAMASNAPMKDAHLLSPTAGCLTLMGFHHKMDLAEVKAGLNLVKEGAVMMSSVTALQAAQALHNKEIRLTDLHSADLAAETLTGHERCHAPAVTSRRRKQLNPSQCSDIKTPLATQSWQAKALMGALPSLQKLQVLQSQHQHITQTHIRSVLPLHHSLNTQSSLPKSTPWPPLSLRLHRL